MNLISKQGYITNWFLFLCRATFVLLFLFAHILVCAISNDQSESVKVVLMIEVLSCCNILTESFRINYFCYHLKATIKVHAYSNMWS